MKSKNNIKDSLGGLASRVILRQGLFNSYKKMSKKDDKKVNKEQILIETIKSKQIDIPVNVIYNEKCELTMSKMKDNTLDYIFTYYKVYSSIPSDEVIISYIKSYI